MEPYQAVEAITEAMADNETFILEMVEARMENMSHEDPVNFPNTDHGLLNFGKIFLFLQEHVHSQVPLELTEGYPSQYSTMEIVILSIVMTAMMVVVIIGNMLVIIAIATESNLTSVQNWFIASLAFADLSLGLVIMPFSLAQELLGYWMFGPLWCDIHAALDVLLSTSSIMNLCLISLDRYWSITRALDYLNNRTQPRVLLMIVTVWLLSAFISIPPLLGWKKDADLDWFYDIRTEQFERNLTSIEFGLELSRRMNVEDFTNFTKTLDDVVFPKCQLSEDLGYVVYSAFGSFYIPSCIMVFVYIKIYFAARDRARRHIKPKLSPNSAKDKFGTASNGEPLINGKPKRVLIGETREDLQNQEEASRMSGEAASVGQPRPVGPTGSSGAEGSTSPATAPAEVKQKASAGIRVVGGLKGSLTKKAKCTSNALLRKEKNSHNGTASNELLTEQAEYNENEDWQSNAPQNEVSTSSDSGYTRCGPLRAGIFHKLRVGRRLSKEAREMIDIGKVKTVSREEFDPAAMSIEREKRRIARQKERRATLILGLIMGAFIACWLPFFILYIIGPIVPVCDPKNETRHCVESWVFSFAFWLGYSNSALNPVIYTVFNKDFRKAFKKILFK